MHIEHLGQLTDRWENWLGLCFPQYGMTPIHIAARAGNVAALDAMRGHPTFKVNAAHAIDVRTGL